MFWSAGCSLLRDEGFFCNLDVLYRGLVNRNCWSKRYHFFRWSKSRTRIRSGSVLSLKCWIRIRNKWIRIRNTAQRYAERQYITGYLDNSGLVDDSGISVPLLNNPWTKYRWESVNWRNVLIVATDSIIKRNTSGNLHRIQPQYVLSSAADPVPFWPLDAGWVKIKIRIRDEHPGSY